MLGLAAQPGQRGPRRAWVLAASAPGRRPACIWRRRIAAGVIALAAYQQRRTGRTSPGRPPPAPAARSLRAGRQVVGLQRFEVQPGLRQVGLRVVQRDLEFSRVEPEQHLACLHRLALMHRDIGRRYRRRRWRCPARRPAHRRPRFPAQRPPLSQNHRPPTTTTTSPAAISRKRSRKRGRRLRRDGGAASSTSRRGGGEVLGSVRASARGRTASAVGASAIRIFAYHVLLYGFPDGRVACTLEPPGMKLAAGLRPAAPPEGSALWTPAKGIALGTRYLGWVWGWAPTPLLPAARLAPTPTPNQNRWIAKAQPLPGCRGGAPYALVLA